MPKVEMTATKDFTYMTRRLTAGDPFEARNSIEAKILNRVRNVADYGVNRRARLAPKPAEVVEEAPKVEDKAPAKPAAKKAPAKRKAKARK